MESISKRRHQCIWVVALVLFPLQLNIDFHNPISDHLFVQNNSVIAQYTTETIITKVYADIDIVSPISSIMDKILTCESGWNNDARGLAGEIGIAQFLPNSWIMFNKLRGSDLDIYSQIDQIDMLSWALDNNYGCHWSCYRHITGLCN